MDRLYLLEMLAVSWFSVSAYTGYGFDRFQFFIEQLEGVERVRILNTKLPYLT
jgi:hypothetical protein